MGEIVFLFGKLEDWDKKRWPSFEKCSPLADTDSELSTEKSSCH